MIYRRWRMWYENAKDNRNRLRVVGIPHRDVPKLELFSTYLQTAHKSAVMSGARDEEELHALKILNLTFKSMLDNNGDLFNTITFEDVKGLDLHELKSDFSKPLEFSDSVRDAYMHMAQKRIRAYDAACDYLDGTGQSQMKSKFDSEDIELMRSTYKDMKADRFIEPAQNPPNEIRQRRTIMLDKDTHMQMCEAVYKNLSQNVLKWQAEENKKNKETEYEY